MEVAVVVACAVLGLLFGSFANVVIHRLPENASLVTPPSACPRCGCAITPRDNVPVISYLVLRGRCRHCRTRISPRYPLVELGMAALFAAVGARVGASWALPGFLLFAWTLAVVAIIDARTRRIPNRLTYPLTPALLTLLCLAAVLVGQPGAGARALLGGLASSGALLMLALISPRGMGMGDVKLAAFIGVGLGYLGWGHVVVGLAGGFLLGGLVALGLLVSGLRTRKDAIPFGPSLAVGALAALLAGEALISAYLRLSGLSALSS